jgi:AcrR family transcriptional regulator
MNDQKEKKVTAHDVLTEFRRKEILEAVERVSKSVGFEHLTMDKVADEAGIAKGTIYKYFSDKDDLLHALFSQSFDGLIAETERVSAKEGKTKDLIFEFASTLSDFSESNRDLILQLHKANYKEKHCDRETEIMTSFMISFENILKNGIEKGELRNLDTRQLSLLFFGMLHHAFFADMHMNEDVQPIEISFVIEVFLNGIKK